jgi:isopentenyldiphosphate isomerase
MKTLRKQIRESFFNPILHFFPLLLFLGVDEFYGMNIAWKITFPVALVLVFYVFYWHNYIFVWHVMLTFLFMGIGLLASLVSLFPIPVFLHLLENKIIVCISLIILIIFREKVQKQVLRFMPRLLPMSNNFNELYRFIKRLIYILVLYISASLILKFTGNNETTNYLTLLRAFFTGLIILLTVYEFLKVLLVRAKLVREEWWPIVNEQGKIIGSIQYLTSLFDEKKYLHPIVRVLLIDKNMIFLQKRSSDDLIFPQLWDTAISNHVQMGETIEHCIERTAIEHYYVKDIKYMYLSNYIHDTKNERHYAFLFVSCQLREISPNPAFVENTKWWTEQQIEENLGTGIFTENFEIEFDLIKRSGLLETGKCNCQCKLKEVIYQQSGNTKKE